MCVFSGMEVVATMIVPRFTPRQSPGLGRQRRTVKWKVCFIAVKITTIIIRSLHLVLRSLGTYWSTRVWIRGLLV